MRFKTVKCLSGHFCGVFEARHYKSPPLWIHYILSFIQEREHAVRMTWGEKILTKWLRELSFHDCRAVVTVCCAFLRGDEGGGDVLISPLPSVTRASLSLSLSPSPSSFSSHLFSGAANERQRPPSVLHALTPPMLLCMPDPVFLAVLCLCAGPLRFNVCVCGSVFYGYYRVLVVG